MKSQVQPQSGSWIEVAREGVFRDAGGSRQNFSRDRLASLAAKYDPRQREAPLVFGHPAVNGPAYGWVKQLKMHGEKLLAYVACVSDEVKAAVDNGSYRYVSMSLYPDDGLRHVGLLGGTPPAIDGLAPVSFSDDAATTIDFNELSKGNQMTIEELTRQLAELQSKLSALTQERDAALKEAAEAKAGLDQSQTEKEKAVAEFAAYREGQEKGALTKRIDQLVAGGKLPPAERPAVEKVAEALRQAHLNFADGQGENTLDTYLASLESRSVSGLMSNFSVPADADTEDQTGHQPLSAKL